MKCTPCGSRGWGTPLWLEFKSDQCKPVARVREASPFRVSNATGPGEGLGGDQIERKAVAELLVERLAMDSRGGWPDPP